VPHIQQSTVLSSIRTIRRLKVRRNEFRSFTLKELHNLTCTVYRRTVWPIQQFTKVV